MPLWGNCYVKSDYINLNKVEVAPNSIEIFEESLTIDISKVRDKYNLSTKKTLFMYGGNLGKPQGIKFLIKCLDSNKDRKDCHFFIVGSGTEYKEIEIWYNSTKPNNITLLKFLPKNEYDELIRACDVDLIFLDINFTIPNYPSRLLSYLENKMPIIVATDINTDIGLIAEKNLYGFSCVSNSTIEFNIYVNNPDLIIKMGNKGYEYLVKNYCVNSTYNSIMSHLI